MLRFRYQILIALVGLAVLGFAAFDARQDPEKARGASAVRLPPATLLELEGTLTYCPGPGCELQQKAMAECGLLHGSFRAEPDFTCTLMDGVHRIICDDIDDEHQCGHMSHADIEYAREELRRYWQEHRLEHVDIDADRREGLYVCRETRRAVSCTFTDRRTKAAHRSSPIRCEFDGCLLFGDPPDR